MLPRIHPSGTEQSSDSKSRASLTTIRLQENEPGLFSFNNIPHLPAPELRTFR